MTELHTHLIRSVSPRPVWSLAFAFGISALLAATAPAQDIAPASVEAATVEIGSEHRFTRPPHDRERLLGVMGSDAAALRAHVFTLANPFFEGRCPGTIGNDLAAEYIQFYLERLGLEPAFTMPAEEPGGGHARTIGSFLQTFSAASTVDTDTQQLTVFPGDDHWLLVPNEEFTPLGVSGNGSASGDVVFVGYGIDDGPEGYDSFGEDLDLDGKIALLLRFEPMDEEGHSQWTEGNRSWSRHAGLRRKLEAVAERGAEGILLVAPPLADDPRAGKLEQPTDTRSGRPMDIPIAMLSGPAADQIVKAGDPDGRDLAALRKYADEGGAPVAFENLQVSLSAALSLGDLTTNNVAAVLPGQGDLADEYLVIGAHYDHVGYGHFGSRGANRGVIHPGADDNASGTAGVLLLAKRLADHYAKADPDAALRSVIFVLFSAEEMGLLGSRHFVSESPVDVERMTAMLNLDMIGGLQDDKLTVYGTGTAAEFDEILPPLFEQCGMDVTSRAAGSQRSDEANFQRRNVPGLHFFSGVHGRYHTPDDTPRTVNFDGAMKIVDLVEDVALDLVARDEKLTFAEVGRQNISTRRSQIKVRFGIAPHGYGEEAGGVPVGEVFPNTSAANAGVRKNDRIMKWNGEDIANMGDWMRKLARHEPGDEVDIVVIRDGEEVTLHVVLLGRDSGG
jgi:aminopeptidase YwaD